MKNSLRLYWKTKVHWAHMLSFQTFNVDSAVQLNFVKIYTFKDVSETIHNYVGLKCPKTTQYKVHLVHIHFN